MKTNHFLFAAIFIAFIFFACGNVSDSSSEDSSSSSSNDPSEESSSSGIPGQEIPCAEMYDPAEEFCFDGKLYARCGGEQYNPLERFCYGNKFYLLCGGEEYNPTRDFCYEEKPYLRCGNNELVPLEEFCFESRVYPICQNAIYNPFEQFCYNHSLYLTCNGEEYDPATQTCFKTKIYSICKNTNNEEIQYDPSIQTCFKNEIYSKCGNAGEFCDDNGNKYLTCGTEKYNINSEFCENNNIYQKCGSDIYSPSTQFCTNNQVLDMCRVLVGYSDFGAAIYENQTYEFDEICQNGQIQKKDLPPTCNGKDLNENLEFCCFGKIYEKSSQSFCYEDELYPTCSRNRDSYTSADGKKYPYNPIDSGCFENKLFANCTAEGITGTCVHGTLKRCRQLGNTSEYIVDPLPGMTCNDNGSITGEINDYYNFVSSGEKYKVAQIGTQIWIAEDLRREDMASNSSTCYNDDTSNCGKSSTCGETDCVVTRYGKLYTWLPAMVNEPSANSNHKGLCPDGFYVPSISDWETLVNYAGGSSVAGGRLKSATTDWDNNGKGTDSYGFSALPGGYRAYYLNPQYNDWGKRGMWWTKTQSSSEEARYGSMISSDTEARDHYQNKEIFMSYIRCLHY